MTATAWVRPVPDSFPDCVTASPPDPPLDTERAREQHTHYVEALREGGYTVVEVPVDDGSPDSAFVEDAAVVIGERVLATRPGHETRRAEVEPVAAVLADRFRVHRMQAPATLDGGDVLIVGRRVFVGASRRTNRAGFLAVAAVAEPQGFAVVSVTTRSVLHLKSGVSAVDDETVVWHPASCDRRELDGVRVLELGGEDPEAANVVRLPDGSVLVGAPHDATADLVAERGHRVRRVGVSEFGRADGGLTCLSIRVR